MKSVCQTLGDQAEVVTHLGLLKMHNRTIDEDFLKHFDFREYYQKLKDGGANLIIRILEAVTCSPKHLKFTKERQLRARVVSL